MRFYFGRRHRYDYDDYDPIIQLDPNSGGKLYKIISSIAIIGIFAAAGLLVLAFTNSLPLSAISFGFVFSVAVICLGAISTLPWIRRFENNDNKKIATAFLIVIGVCVLLWLICVWLGIIIYKRAQADIESLNAAIVLIWIIKITLLISIQLVVSSTITNVLLKYKKTMIPFQIITYASHLYIDFYLTYLIICLGVNSSGPYVMEGISFLGHKATWVLLILAFVYSIISSSILRSIEVKKMRNEAKEAAANGTNDAAAPKQEAAKTSDTPQQKLENLKKMYDQELITKEEYEQKRSEILKDL